MAINPSSRLKTKSSSIRELFKSSYFEIPVNQREYRWEIEQREKLWDDLEMTLVNDNCIDGGEAKGHFLGAIVVIGAEQSLDSSRWSVIDGQQRLTTLTILADCLRPFVDQIQDGKIKRNLSHVLLDCILSPGSEADIPRLKLNRGDNFYKESLIEHESMESKQEYWVDHYSPRDEVQKNIKSAFEYFSEKISDFLDSRDERDQALRDLVDTFIDGFYFLVVRTEEVDMAYRLFETLNERGLDLSQADLIRNVLLEHASDCGSSVVDQVVELWSSVIDDYESQSLQQKLELPQIIQFSYSYRHEVVKKEKIFDKVSSDLRSGRHDSLEFSGEFKKDSSSWCSFLLGDLTNWNQKIEDAQYAICGPLWKSHCAPFIMAAMDRFSSSISELEESLILCEHYLFRQGAICRDSVSALQEFFGEAAAQLKSGQELSNVKAYFQRKSPDSHFVSCFENAYVRNMKLGFYTMWKIENHLATEAEMDFRPKSQSAAQHLEHIIPRNPCSSWNDVEKNDDFPNYLNRLGNFLVLNGNINQHIKNKPFDYKVSNDSQYDYAHSQLKLVKELIAKRREWTDNGEWTFESIERRQKHLAEEYAGVVWSLD